MKKIALIFLFVSISFAQYTPDDYELMKTTFLREFNKDILDQYLQSGDDAKVKAALLSIAQSDDTAFVPTITMLNYQKYGNDIAFTLGEIGECKASSNYILSKLQNGDNQYSVALFEALGKIGTVEDLLECTKIYQVTKSEGYPLAVFNFHIRDIVDSTESDVNLLLKNVNLTNDSEKLFRSIFTLYRVAPDKVKQEDLELILKSNIDTQIKLYALGILRKTQSFPFAFDLVEKLLESDEWNVRCEAARTVCYFPYKTAEQVDLFLNLLFDENPNVARVAAQSLVNLNIEDDKLEDRFLEALDLLLTNDFTTNVKGEILLALQNFYPDDTVEIINEQSENLNKVYLIQLLENYTYDPYYSFEKLTGMLNSASDYEKFLIHSSLANFYDTLKTDADYSKLILEEYNSGTPLDIVLYNYVIDSSFVVNNSVELKNELTELVDTKLSDPDYNQAISSLFVFTDYIDTNFTKSLLQKISQSTNYALQYDLRNEIDQSELTKQYREQLFNSLSKYSFKYSKAIVETIKGEFTIEFTPGVAPISVGNFIYLAENNFYDGVIFHRVVPNFVIQTGDPSGTGWSGPDYTIVSEFSAQPFDSYYVGMASSGKDTEGSQWFVMQNNFPHLNGNYTNFGKVIDGFDVVNTIDQYDKVENIELIK